MAGVAVFAMTAAGLSGAAVLAGAGTALAATSCPAAAISGSTATVTCAYTGAEQAWTAPAGVAQVTVTLDGGQGGSGAGSGYTPNAAGGKGATVTATVPVTPGDTYQVQAGGAAPGNGNEAGGFGGGGGSAVNNDLNDMAGGGGGASELSQGSLVLAVAGGGGGGAGNDAGGTASEAGGAGGGSAAEGTTGTGLSGANGGGGGQPGTATTGGPGGTAGAGSVPGATAGAPGTAGSGGAGGSSPYEGGNGGGGGGGYYGGGGGGGGGTTEVSSSLAGAGGGGGGGGSDYVMPSGWGVNTVDGAWSGNGQVIISYALPCPAPVVSAGVATVTCGWTGAEQRWTAPPWVNAAQVTALGAQGGTGSTSPVGIPANAPGGLGAQVTATLLITPGDTYEVQAGGAGGTPGGGFGGGAPGGGGSGFFPAGGGGGASELSLGSQPLMLAAGGGGGGGSAFGAGGSECCGAAGGAGGGSAAAGTAGADLDGGYGGAGGQPGTGTAGGAGGTAGSGSYSVAGTAGTAGAGGSGGDDMIDLSGGGSGGGGGGGLYGGGGGGGGSYIAGSAGDAGGGAGGGGGSDYIWPARRSPIIRNGVSSGNGAVVISYPALTVTTAGLPDGIAGITYSQGLSATDGEAPYTWSVVSGSLPAGLSLSTAGVISGTPTAATTATFTVQATDSWTPAQTATAQLSLTVDPALAVTSTSLPGGIAGTAYSQQLSATAGTSPYSWSVASGSLPAGLSLSTAGVISGTPSAVGTATFTVQVTDSGSPQQTATKPLTLTVSPVLAVTTASLAGGTAGKAYSQQLSATGGTPPYSWSVASGSLPAGLSLSWDGVISGKPTAAGTATFTVQATDSGSSPQQMASASLSIKVIANPVIAAKLSSSHPESKYGWYPAPVTVTFTCTAGSAPLTGPCPAPVTLSGNGAGQKVSKTIHGTDGGTATVSVTVSIDQTAPKVTVTGITNKATYEAPGPATITCAGTESLSGLAGPCSLTVKRAETAISWTATATSKAGITTTVTGKAALTDFYIAGAKVVNGRYVVTTGKAFTVKAYLLGVTTAPRYVAAVRAPAKPAKTGAALKKAASSLWTITVTIPSGSKTGDWSLGVLSGGTLHIIQLTVQS